MSLREQMVHDEREKNEAWDELQHVPPQPTRPVVYEPAYDEQKYVKQLEALRL